MSYLQDRKACERRREDSWEGGTSSLLLLLKLLSLSLAREATVLVSSHQRI